MLGEFEIKEAKMEDPEYEEKFQKLLTYVPFLNNMIRNLEAAAEGSSNPRQAQLDKIRALRALLTNKKRMRKENLQKCQQVLLNLRAKVEQKEMFADLKGLFGPDPGFAIDPPTPQEKSDLEAVRNKLKIVAKRPGDDKETLPEILRVNEVEDIHTAGSKEPALFQRRPNKSSLSPIHRTPTKIKDEKVLSHSASKRNYTRVLVSPDSSARRRWSTPNSDDDKPLFCRRSPRRSPRRYSPSYHKRERKKSSKESTRKSKDLNITLKVPEDSLSTLNTKDIFSRIMHCKDGDVDIDTLRGLREQILTELKKTGARDDISELILKSYDKKKNRKNRMKKEVEEGELSDSESEVIENVYGSLTGNLVLKDQSEAETSTDKDKGRKIQICLVINPDTKPNPNTSTSADNSGFLELEMYDKQSKEFNKTDLEKEKNKSIVIKKDDDDLKKVKPDMKNNVKEESSIDKDTSKIDASGLQLQQPPEEEKTVIIQKEPAKNTANFYKPMTDGSELQKIEDSKEPKYAQAGTDRKTDIKLETPNTSKDLCLIEAELEKMEKPVEIPLLNDPIISKTPTDSKLSEIDILQALKNEILSEVITIPGAETGTPLLHQPKLNKVASAKEILPKKRISIENYKQKTDRDKIANSVKIILRHTPYKDDNTKKPSLKLTEKECERFNIQKKMPFDDDSSDGDDGGEIEASDLYSDLAPKSPDRDESIDMELASPVIIPGDPVKPVPVNHNADVDMRTLPILAPNQIKTSTLFGNITGLSSMESISASKTDAKSDQMKIQNKSVLFDPRVRRDVNNSSQSPSPHTVNSDRMPRPAFSNISPASNPVMTPNARSYEMTPNHQSFDFDPSNKKHVYVPSLTMSHSREREHSVVKDSKVEPPGERKSRWEDIGDNSSWSSSDVSINTRYTDSYTGDKYNKGKRHDRYSLDNRDCFAYKRSECPRTPLPSFGRSDVPMTPLHSFARAECPTTPTHHFGRSECPPTPSNSFGRLECPPTPSHSFGRSECPPTPSHSFGRSDGPSSTSHPFGSHSFNVNEHALTLSHQFNECPPSPYYGRNECPPTPNHGFGRSECPSTPNHPFGRSDFNAQKYTKDPRLNRKPEYESNSNLNERDRGYYKDSSYNRGSSYKSQKPFGGSENYTSQDREQGRNKSRYYAPEQTGRQLSKDLYRREKTVGSIPMDYERERPLSRERGHYNSGYDDVALRRGNQRERSIGRGEHTEDKRERSVGRYARAEDTYLKPSSRGPSVRRDSNDPVNKSLSVKSYAGCSFRIDTSVNETFQKFLENGKDIQVLDYNFDARRKRATSVGRALFKESRGGQVSDGSKQNSETLYRKEVFRRASSVGRDLAKSTLGERSFQEIKADFKTYSHPEKEYRKFDTDKIRNIDTKCKTSTEHIARNKREKEFYEKYKEEKQAQSFSKVTYSPRKNFRDPRMRIENQTKNKYEDPRARKSGIVYSNDNIVKGAILASGYGVKNYKIPKIKRVVEEKEVPKKEESVNEKADKDKFKQKNIEKITDKEGTKEEKAKIKEKTNDKSNDKNKITQKNKDLPKEKSSESPKHKIKEIPKEKINESDNKSDSEEEKPIQTNDMSESDVQVGRRSTRLSRKLAVTTPVKDVVSKSKKSKKAIISDSDSETDNSVTEKVPKNAEKDLSTTTPEPPPQVTSPGKEKIGSKQLNAADNFGLELEMFSDNVVSDHVLENINALIATLDNDHYSSKSESSNNFTNEITLENMMQNITSPRDNFTESRDEFANVLKAVGELSQTTDNNIQENSLSDLNKIHEDISNFPHVNTKVSQERKISEDCSSNTNSTTQSLSFDNLLPSVKSFEALHSNKEEKKKDEALPSSNIAIPINKPANEDIVSTSEMEKVTLPVQAKSKIEERSLDGCSTPDSTINIEVLNKNINDECQADSTNGEMHSEMNVTSTGSVESKSILSSTKTESDLELGNLLTMLQDKSKIKKLLTMLGDQSGDNDKIKKKLEKLSEIVSEDEAEEKTEQSENKPEISVLTDNKKPNANQTVDKEALKQTTIDDEATKEMQVDEKATKEMKIDEGANEETKVEEEALKKTESQSHEDEQTKLNKDNDENKFKSDEETQLNKDEDQKNYDDQDKDENFEDFIGEDVAETEETDLQVTRTKYKKKISAKKPKFSRKGKGRWAKKVSSVAEKRVTRATAAVETIKKPKKPPRELQQLHDDIKEMGLEDDILSATGIRMCRLAKMVDEKKEEVTLPEPEAVVVLENIKTSADKNLDNSVPEKVRKKPGPKPKLKISTESLPELEKQKYKPGPKSKTRNKKELDPYAFETESAEDTTIEKANEDDSDNSSDSDNYSLASAKSFGSSELLADVIKNKKLKRKRGRGWQDGVIKPKNKKKKLEDNLESNLELPGFKLQTEKQDYVPDPNCFTDRNYCFRKNESRYTCRLCGFACKDIVRHYVSAHPHEEIPLSRMAPEVAKEVVVQCKGLNLNSISKIFAEKYICLFCFKEFRYNSSVMETFFWHIVSQHTGECKRTCSECPNETQCPYSLDIPPPPDQTKGQLIGFLCKRCNFTQLSLENLKQHVVRRHNDEQTAVHKITLSAISKKTMKKFSECKIHDPPARQASSSPPELPIKPSNLPEIPVKPSNLAEIPDKPINPPEMPAKPSRLPEVPAKPSENSSDAESNQSEAQLRKLVIRGQLASIKSKITFEGDDNVSELSDLTSKEPIETQIKKERIESEGTDEILQDVSHTVDTSEITQAAEVDHQPVQILHQEDEQSSLDSGLKYPASQPSNDIVDYPHFKINISESGAKEYICCINGTDNHFKTTLLISMKKHVQLKHSENWDGYCFVCKVIVTPQGAHKFKDCLQHYLDKHMDNFPIYQKEVLPESALKEVPDKPIRQTDSPAPSKPIINVRPINELISTAADNPPKEILSFPVIKNVVSLGAESPRLTPTYPSVGQEIRPTEVRYKYEEVQAMVMLNKHRVVLETMMARDKLIQVFKCAGRFCSFTSDSAEDAVLHASTHQRIGGADALNCSYCNFDAVGNAIDLVMHVFKAHGHCQYSCAQCFYRAAASQSVAAHTARVHGVELSEAIALRTTVATTAGDGGRVLTREEAVPYYDCYHAENGSLCKFRNYTHDKFIDHLLQKHSGTTSHPCYICQKEESSPSELVLHMKTHGLQLYQCTWCVCGADNDLEMLGHVSSEHPTKQPQAYLRIITNKEGSTELRVLPLAFLNKMKVSTEDVSPSAARENPQREAERSIDLEKLIGGLTMVTEVEPQPELSTPAPAASHTQAIPGAVQKPVAAAVVAEIQTGILAEIPNAVASISAPMQIDVTTVPTARSPAATITTDLPLTITEVPIKAELTETSISLPSEVVVLDSEDEDPSDPVLPVIDLSDEETTPSNNEELMQINNKKVPNELLATCPKCKQICKSINGLKKHFFYCYPNKDEGCKCAHCPYQASSRGNLLHHYVGDHCDRNKYQCGMCRNNHGNLSAVKRHLWNVHKEKDYVITSVVENGVSWYLVNAAKKDREKKELPKRKLSSNATDTLKRRYSPQEIHLLPINPILDHLVYCEICEFSTKVRLNMVRHLQLHAEQQPVAQTAPVNPVPHLETNEKHFDKMVNLASSSLVPRAAGAPAAAARAGGAAGAGGAGVFVAAPRELAAAYPRPVAARARLTCGALGCTYTSVDDAMLKRHWEALHAGSFNFRCVHCPNTQTLDTSKPITAQRVVYHLKMHDDTLYACSKCHFYHWKRDVMEKHITDVHPGIQVQIYIVRESASAAAAAATASTASTATASPSAAPTMDLKAWQCGLCKFKSMLRPEVVEHSFKTHQSKMQFRCGYCPYRASVIENVNNHLAHSHANEPAEVIHYYYREGDLPNDADGVPRWLRQRKLMGSNMPQVKTEAAAEPEDQAPVVTPPPVNIDLNLVKREVVDAAALETLESMEDLCKRYGQFCEPNGLKFKCPLCNVIFEDNREAMQSHLYEELQYRKWGCGRCNYKAFHKAGLTEHMNIEHFRQYDHIELPKDTSKENWVAAQLEHQAAIIDKYKANLAKQKMVNERVTKPAKVATPPPVDAVKEFSVAELERTFGEFGAPSNGMYCCPMCSATLKDEAAMRDHLEFELSSIRWGCSNCSDGYANFHEAQFHCKGHDGPSRPVPREPALRAAWLTNVIEAQKKILQTVSTAANSEPPSPEKSFTETDNNSLLVVRYDPGIAGSRKRAAPESDDERLVIDEGGARSRQWIPRPCPYCNYKAKYYNSWKEHVLKHFNLKPFMCKFCDYGCSHKPALLNHTKRIHPGLEPNLKMTPIPSCAPESYVPSAEAIYTPSPKKRLMVEDEANVPKVICLFCEISIPETDVDNHLHENIRPDFARKGDVVVKCCICLVLRLDVKSLQDHHNLAHPHVPVNYALFKLRYDTRETHICGHCDDIGFKFLRDLKTHHSAVHPNLSFKYTTVPYYASADKESRKKEEVPSKRCAKKSTTKLPGGKTVAKKSTTKLPYSVPYASDDGFSCYKTKPEPLENYPNVTAIMSFCNRMVPFPLKKLSEIINIKPKVILKDIRAGPSSDMTL